MSLTFIRILFWSIIPFAVYGLVKSIGLIKNSFSNDIKLEISYLQKSGEFSVLEPGTYSIWQKSPLYKRTPVDQYKPVIYNKESGDTIPLNHSWMRPHSNNGTTGKMELFTFYAPVGNYMLELKDGASISKVETAITEMIASNKITDLSKYFIQVKKSQPVYMLILGIMLTMLSIGCLIAGFVLGIVADKIFPTH